MLDVFSCNLANIKYLLWHQIRLKLGTLIYIFNCYLIVLDQSEHVLKFKFQIKFFRALIKKDLGQSANFFTV